MKILQINKFCYLKGGSERYFLELSEFLSEKGHDVVLWGTQNSKNDPSVYQEHLAQFNDLSKREGLFKDLTKVKRIFWNGDAEKKLEEVIKKEKPDIAHLHNVFSHLAPSIIFVLKKYNIPIVLTLHDYKLFCPNYQFFSQGKICFDCLHNGNYRSCIYKKCLKNSLPQSIGGYLEAVWQKDILRTADKIDMFITPSAFMRERAIEWGIPEKKVVHIPNLLSIDKFSNLLYNDANAQEKYFLFVGRLSREKGVDLLIKSFMKISQKIPQWKLKIVGDGPEMERLQKLAQSNKQIEFAGWKSKISEVKEMIVGSYSMVVPSCWAENFPFTVLESFVLGKPVIAANIGGLPEMVKNEKTGLLFGLNNQAELAEKMLWMVNHPNEVKQMGEAARKEVLVKCSPETHYQALIKIYERIKNY